MPIRIQPEKMTQLRASIKRYVAESMDDEIGDLKASLLLEFFVREIGPTIYNTAVVDAQTRLQDAVMDLDGSCHEPDPGYWTKR